LANKSAPRTRNRVIINRRGKTSNTRTRKAVITFGVLTGAFGALIVFAGVNAIDQLYQAEGLCLSTSLCPGTLSGASVYGNVHTALEWSILEVALGTGTAVGGFVLAFNGAKTRDEDWRSSSKTTCHTGLTVSAYMGSGQKRSTAKPVRIAPL